ncbi:hypothetical protein DPMN_063615 [Dreissena polymorpha]|uniref:Uncharacterized protein n=1 Tax=Dreissena polymorpha TaxID=45954 RepID=A0A9D4HLB2_DREPO|nr:hypothetical protein DPMN_063615 [Dreissena polymorpha]
MLLEYSYQFGYDKFSGTPLNRRLLRTISEFSLKAGSLKERSHSGDRTCDLLVARRTPFPVRHGELKHACNEVVNLVAEYRPWP